MGREHEQMSANEYIHRSLRKGRDLMEFYARTVEDRRKEAGKTEWRRIERRIQSRWWQIMHNMIDLQDNVFTSEEDANAHRDTLLLQAGAST